MTRPRPTWPRSSAVASRSSSREYGPRDDTRATPGPARPGGLPHGGAGRPRRAVCRTAAIRRSPTTPVATATVRSARPAGGRWLERRRRDLLPVEYYHVVFTLPAALARSGLAATRGWCTTCCSGGPRRRCGRWPPTRSTWAPRSACWRCCTPGARTCAIIRTCTAWSTGGGLSCDARGQLDGAARWLACRPGFFLPVRVLSRVFRGKFLAGLRQPTTRAG